MFDLWFTVGKTSMQNSSFGSGKMICSCGNLMVERELVYECSQCGFWRKKLSLHETKPECVNCGKELRRSNYISKFGKEVDIYYHQKNTIDYKKVCKKAELKE
ncbi:MAG: hypothetical protein CL528_13335 [Aequorivita sp.]|nr:hypothetical protein [Aequorivita sp.]